MESDRRLWYQNNRGRCIGVAAHFGDSCRFQFRSADFHRKSTAIGRLAPAVHPQIGMEIAVRPGGASHVSGGRCHIRKLSSCDRAHSEVSFNNVW